MAKKIVLDIFNYEFDWKQSNEEKTKSNLKEECCKKYKKKSEKKCKNCPKRTARP